MSTRAALIESLPDNTSGEITPADIRGIVNSVPVVQGTYSSTTTYTTGDITYWDDNYYMALGTNVDLDPTHQSGWMPLQGDVITAGGPNYNTLNMGGNAIDNISQFSSDGGNISTDGSGDLFVQNLTLYSGTVAAEGSSTLSLVGNGITLNGNFNPIISPNNAGINVFDDGWGNMTVAGTINGYPYPMIAPEPTLDDVLSDGNFSYQEMSIGSLYVQGSANDGTTQLDGGFIATDGNGNLALNTVVLGNNPAATFAYSNAIQIGDSGRAGTGFMFAVDVNNQQLKVGSFNINNTPTTAYTTFLDSSGNLYGNGSNLTNLNASHLTGALPTISGANLTSLNASHITGSVSQTAPIGNIPTSFRNTQFANESNAISPSLGTPTANALMRISWTARIKTAATSTSTLGPFTITYTDGNQNASTSYSNGITSTVNSAGTVISGVYVVFAKSGTGISSSFSYGSTGTISMAYDLCLYSEYLG